jgi:hypothetical protein
LDIETKFMLVGSFGIREQNLTHHQIVDDDDGRLIHCIALKWGGEKRTKVLSEWEHGYEGMIRGVHEALTQADAVCTYNGTKFDLPKIWGQFALLHISPPGEPTQIDLYKAIRKLGYECNKLDYIAPMFGVGVKVKHEGFDLWKAVREGCPKARKRMVKYCAGDADLTERLYYRIRPFIKDHPHMGMTPALACGACGSHQLTHQGRRRTKASFIERLQCQRCGSWSQGRRTRA